MAQCTTKQHTSNNQKANKFGKGITAFQTGCQRRDSKLIPHKITAGIPGMNEAFNAHKLALIALDADPSRENFLAERAASKALAALR